MSLYDEIYGSSKYMSGAELGDQTLRVKIGSVDVADLQQKDGVSRRRLILSFPGQDKRLPLNKTNAGELRRLLGKDENKWVGAPIELFTVPTQYGPGIRIRPQRAPLKDDLDDAIGC